MCFSLKERAKIGHWGDFVIFFGFQQHFFSTSIKNVDHLSQWIGQKYMLPTYLWYIWVCLNIRQTFTIFYSVHLKFTKKMTATNKKPLPFLVEQKGNRRKLRIWELRKGGLKVSISPTFFCAAFSYKSFAWSFWCLQFRFVFFWRKCAHKMLVKLTIGRSKKIVSFKMTQPFLLDHFVR